MQLTNSLRRTAASRGAARAGAAPGLRRGATRSANNAPSNAVTLADAEAVHEAWVSGAEAPAAAAAVAEAPAAAANAELFQTTSRDAYYTRRHELVLSQFPNALGVDDFISRVEIALAAHGFRGDNSIGEAPARDARAAPRTNHGAPGAAPGAPTLGVLGCARPRRGAGRPGAPGSPLGARDLRKRPTGERQPPIPRNIGVTGRLPPAPLGTPAVRAPPTPARRVAQRPCPLPNPHAAPQLAPWHTCHRQFRPETAYTPT